MFYGGTRRSSNTNKDNVDFKGAVVESVRKIDNRLPRGIGNRPVGSNFRGRRFILTPYYVCCRDALNFAGASELRTRACQSPLFIFGGRSQSVSQSSCYHVAPQIAIIAAAAVAPPVMTHFGLWPRLTASCCCSLVFYGRASVMCGGGCT